MIDDKLLDEIEEKAKVAESLSPGNWAGYPQDGPGGNCILAEVFGSDGKELFSVNSREDGTPEEGTAVAMHCARMDPPTSLSLVAEIRELRAQNAALFKIAAAGRDYHEKPLADEVRG